MGVCGVYVCEKVCVCVCGVVVWCGVVWCGVVWWGVVWRGVVRSGVEWFAFFIFGSKYCSKFGSKFGIFVRSRMIHFSFNLPYCTPTSTITQVIVHTFMIGIFSCVSMDTTSSVAMGATCC